MTHSPTSKVCRRCDPSGKEQKPASAFYANTRHADGLSSFCKDCMRKQARNYSKAHREEKNAYQNKWRRDNPEKVKAQKQRQNKRIQQSRRQLGGA